MLESTVKQLAGEDRISRLDAYESLSMAVRAADDIPDEQALRDKLSLLTQFIQRDMTAQLPTGGPDNVMSNKALVLLASLIWKNQHIPQDFSKFFVDYSITSLEAGTVSKDVAKHILFIVGRQNFNSKVMKSDRVSRLLNVAHCIFRHYEGKGIVLGRHQIYLKLLKQERTTVISNLYWLDDIFEDMLNASKEVRREVIKIALEIAYHVGTESKVSKYFIDLFARPHEDSGSSYARYYGNRLSAMLKSRDDAALVPQIWTVAVLLLRSKPGQLDHWQPWKPIWLHILQKCFNINDSEVKSQANQAWNRLVFAMQPDEKTPPGITGMLLQPFMGQLRPRSAGKPQKPVLQSTYSGICNLLYYALRPNASAAQLDLHWDTYVIPILERLLGLRSDTESQLQEVVQKEGVNHAISILKAFLAAGANPPTPYNWRIDRSMSDERMRFEELPPLDPKWIRKNSARVVNMLQHVLRKAFLGSPAVRFETSILWNRFLKCIALAGAKEIKVSQETMACIARIYTMLGEFWQSCPCASASGNKELNEEFLELIQHYLQEMVTFLGLLPFTEKRLTIDTTARLSISATPSTSSDKIPKTVKTPIQCLVSIFTQNGGCTHNNAGLTTAVEELLTPFNDQGKAQASLYDLWRELYGALPDPDSSFNRDATEAVWCALVRIVLRTGTDFPFLDERQPIGASIRDYVKLLEYGLLSLNQSATEDWSKLYYGTCVIAEGAAGKGGMSLGVVEPVAQSLKKHCKDNELETFIGLFNDILRTAKYAPNAKSLQAARQKLWGPNATMPRSTSIDPFMHFYLAADFFLKKAYEGHGLGGSNKVIELVTRIMDLITYCPDSVLATVLEELSGSLALWIEDVNNILIVPNFMEMMEGDKMNIWEAIRKRIKRNRSVNSESLARLAGIYTAAFSSKHKFVVNSALELWNETYGNCQTLTYPNNVARALARLRKVATLKLPTFPKIRNSDVPPPVIHILDSDEDNEPSHFANSGPPVRRSVSPFLASSPLKDLRTSSPRIRLGDASSPGSHTNMSASTSARKRRPSKPEMTPKLRHDNSQIQFAVIESSPVRETQETQHLTENQREVKERQQEEAQAMFADLRSSPRLKKKSGRLSLSSDLPTSLPGTGTRSGTPPIGLSAPLVGDDFIASSPTPQRSQKDSQAAVYSDDEGAQIPSSPPRGRSRTPSPRANTFSEITRTEAPDDNDVSDVEPVNQPTNEVESPAVAPAGSITLTAPYMRDAAQNKPHLSPHLSFEASTLQEATNNVDPTKKSTEDVQPRKPSLSRASSSKLNEVAVKDPAEAAPEEIASTEPTPKRKRGRPKKAQSERADSRPKHSNVPVKAQSERARSRSSSLSELDERMVRSLRKTVTRDDENDKPDDSGTPKLNEYFLLGADDTFSPDEYLWIEPSPQHSPEHPPPKQRASAKKDKTKEVTAAVEPKVTRSSERKSISQLDGRESSLPESSQQSASGRSSQASRAKAVAPITIIDKKRKKSVNIGSDDVPARSSSLNDRSRKRRKAKDAVIADSQQTELPPVAEDAIAVPPLSHSSQRRSRSKKDSDTPDIELPQQKKQKLSRSERRKRSKSRSASVADRSEIENSQPTVLDAKESLDLDTRIRNSMSVQAMLSPVQEEPENNAKKHGVAESIDFGKPAPPDDESVEASSSRGDPNQGSSEVADDEVMAESEMIEAQLSPIKESHTQAQTAQEAETDETQVVSSPDLDMHDVEAQILVETSFSQSRPQSSSSSPDLPGPSQSTSQHEGQQPVSSDPSSTVANTTKSSHASQPSQSQASQSQPQSQPPRSGTQAEEEDKEINGKELGANILDRMRAIMDDLPKASLTRGEATVIEGLIWDMKAEMYQAELRGRK